MPKKIAIKDMESEEKKKQRLLNKLSNWQKHQWVKAGRVVEDLEKFSKLIHWKQAQ